MLGCGFFRLPRQISLNKSRFSVALKDVIRNDAIRALQIRVTYENNGKKEWQIMSKKDALAFAKDRNMDLILGSINVINYYSL